MAEPSKEFILRSKLVLEFLWRGISPLLPFVAGFFFIMLAIVIILAIIAAIFQTLANFALDGLRYVIRAVFFAYPYMLKFLAFVVELFEEYPVMSIGTFLLAILYINKSILNRVSEKAIGKTIFILSIIFYLLYKLSYSTNNYMLPELSSFVSSFISMMYIFVYPESSQTFNINFDRESILILVVFLFSYWVNSRLIWLISIAVFEAMLIYFYSESINTWLLSIPTDYYRILQGMLTLVFSTPFLFAIWIFRDNDKYRELSGKIRELDLRERELYIKRQDLDHSKDKFEYEKKNRENINK